MKTISVLFILFLTLNACEDTKLKPPFIITNLSEGDGCCDVSFKDSVGNKGWRCTSFKYLKTYKIGDTLR